MIVDGKPFLILGAQCNNSSAWPAMLPKVWLAAEALHVNTLEIPVYWEQSEPQLHNYDYSVVDAIITQARKRDLRLVLFVVCHVEKRIESIHAAVDETAA